jgi:hypothetical protein
MVSETRALVRVGIIRRVLTSSNYRDRCTRTCLSVVGPSKQGRRRKDARSFASYARNSAIRETPSKPSSRSLVQDCGPSPIATWQIAFLNDCF